jgi:carbohydrate ABC transporter membrane protein 1, CUT1 family (TC 3.A.1.1.-)
MRVFPLHLLLSLGALLTLGLYAERLGFVPRGLSALGLGLYGALALYALRFGLWHLPLLLGLLGAWFPPAPFLVPLLFALALGPRLPEKAQGALYGWALVWPALALLLVWHVFPTFYAFYLSLFERVNFLRPAAFAGLENYRILLYDPLFWRALGNTFWYVVFTVPTGLLLATLVAILLNTRIAFQGLYRTLYFLPYITALTAAAAVWRWIYHPEFGFLNWLLSTPRPGLAQHAHRGFRPLAQAPGGGGPGLLGRAQRGLRGRDADERLALSGLPGGHPSGGASGHPQGVLRGGGAGRSQLLAAAPPHHWPLLSPTTFFLFTWASSGPSRSSPRSTS